MALPARRWLFVGVSALLLASVAQAARSSVTPATERGWKPVLMLAGEGDPARAVGALRGVAELWRVTLQHTEVDAATADFMRRALGSLRSFDLQGMYRLLPQQNGPFRELTMRGQLSAGRYVIGRPPSADFEVEPDGKREQSGDSSFVLRSRGVDANDGDTHYLIQARGGVVLGKVAWPMVTEANRAWLRLLTSEDSVTPEARPMVALRQTALAANPALGAEDLELIATLWEAFPRMSYLVSALGRIDDVVVAGQSPKHVRLALSMDPKRMAQRYPELASYLSGLDRLLDVQLDWIDAQGRTLATLRFDSEHLQAGVELYTKDGLILPFQAGHVFVDAAFDPSHDTLSYTTRLRADFRMMGIASHLRDGRMDWRYEPTARGMQLQGHMTHVPTITVDGAALGIIPPGLVDAFIPGDIHGLIRDFIGAACKGNEGRGVELIARFDQRPSGVASIDAKLAFEALDNFLVKLGVGFFNDRVLPDADVSADVKRLMVDAQAALSADVERYARAH